MPGAMSICHAMGLDHADHVFGFGAMDFELGDRRAE